MNIINWNDCSANLKALEGISPIMEPDEQQEIFFRMLGLDSCNESEYGQFGWTGYFRQTKLHKAKVSKVFYIELRATTRSLQNTPSAGGWMGSELIVIIGYAPKYYLSVPNNLLEILAVEYPVTIKSASPVTMEQGNILIMSLAIKEASSVLYQVHQNHKIEE